MQQVNAYKQCISDSDKRVYLPADIACPIIELEMYVRDRQTGTKQRVLELLQHYTRAIEFYQEQGDKSYVQYQNRMQQLLLRPSISSMLEGRQASIASKRQHNEQEVRRAASQARKTMEKLIDSSSQQAKKQEALINKTLDSQQKSLEERIQRKRINSARKVDTEQCTRTKNISNSAPVAVGGTPVVVDVVSSFEIGEIRSQLTRKQP